MARQAVRANARGYREALRFAELYAPGARAWAIEGTRQLWRGTCRFLGAAAAAVARRSAVEVRREALGQLRGLIVTAPDRLREQLRGLPDGKLLGRCSRMRRSSSQTADEVATRLVLRSLARRIEAATLEAGQQRELLGHVRALAPALLDKPGVDPIVAAQPIVA